MRFGDATRRGRASGRRGRRKRWERRPGFVEHGRGAARRSAEQSAYLAKTKQEGALQPPYNRQAFGLDELNLPSSLSNEIVGSCGDCQSSRDGEGTTARLPTTQCARCRAAPPVRGKKWRPLLGQNVAIQPPRARAFDCRPRTRQPSSPVLHTGRASVPFLDTWGHQRRLHGSLLDDDASSSSGRTWLAYTPRPPSRRAATRSFSLTGTTCDCGRGGWCAAAPLASTGEIRPCARGKQTLRACCSSRNAARVGFSPLRRTLPWSFGCH